MLSHSELTIDPLSSDGRPLPLRCCWIGSRSVQGSSSPVGEMERQKPHRQKDAALQRHVINRLFDSRTLDVF